MDKPTERILERIRKMLAMAEDNANIHESATAAAMASKLMEKYNLDHADVMIDEMEDDDIIAYEVENEGSKIPAWMNHLCVPTARLHDCEVRFMYEYATGKRRTIVQFLGQKEDVQVAAWVFAYLCDEVRRFSKVYRRQQRKLYGGGGHGTNMGDYREGLVDEINLLLQQMKREKDAELNKHKTGTALVVMKQDMITKKFHVSYGKGRQRSISQQAAYGDGAKDGRTVRIRTGIGADKAKGKIK